MTNLFGREQPRHVFVGARGHNLALALEVGLDHAQLADADRVVEADEADLAVLENQIMK